MNLDAQKLIIWAIIGIVAGWLASVVVGGGGGLLRYLITGLIGAFVGGFVLAARRAGSSTSATRISRDRDRRHRRHHRRHHRAAGGLDARAFPLPVFTGRGSWPSQTAPISPRRLPPGVLGWKRSVGREASGGVDRDAHGCRPVPASALTGTRGAGMTAIAGRERNHARHPGEGRDPVHYARPNTRAKIVSTCLRW